MSITISTLLDNPTAAAFGAAGLACQMIWPLLTKRRSMLGVQMGIGMNYAVQYSLMDAWSGAAVCIIGASQTLVALLVGENPRLRVLGLAFLPVVATAGMITWAGLPTLFVLIASALIMIGRLQHDTIRLRMFMLASAPFAMGYDLLVGAAPALIGACISLAISLAALRAELRKRNRTISHSRYPGIGGAHQTVSV
ncbi:MAG: hypothetical protein HON65_14590 [Rhodospirillales bacterium]|jgi:hypothetical protein|nr:hypothetical protein [Rhodospirillales bacterium]